MRDVAQVSRILVEIEAHCPVNELVYKGIKVWPLVRGHLASHLLSGSQPGGCGGRHPQPPALVAETFERIEEHARCLSQGAADVFFFTVGFEYAREGGLWFNKFFDPLKEILVSEGRTWIDFETGFPGGPFEPKRFQTIKIDALTQLAAQLVGNPGEIDGFDVLSTFLRENRIVSDLGHEHFVVLLESMLAQARLFRVLLDQVSPRVAFLVCYYHDRGMAFLKACRDLGIPSVEVEHSIIESQCMYYANWTRVPKEGYELLPDRFWTWGEPAARTLRTWADACPGRHVPLVGGNLWLARHLPAPALMRDREGCERVILFTLAGIPFEPVSDLIPAAFTEALSLAPSGWRWIVRLHYKMDERIRCLVAEHLVSWSHLLDIQLSTTALLYDLIKACDVHLCTVSTTQLEAEALGVPNIVLGEMGRAHFSSEIAAGVYFHAPDGRTLVDLIVNRPTPARREPPLMETSSDKARETLRRLVTQDTDHAVRLPGEGLPEVFSLETTLACNLRCPECAIGGGMIERKKGFLPFEKFKIVADKIRPFAKLFFLHIWGEPMLNKEIIPMVRYASQFCRTNISTNANMLTPEKAEALITSGVAEIIVSIDGVTQEVYQQYRVGGDVSKAFAGLEMLNRLNREHRAGVHILPQFIVFRHNEHEMRAFKERCAVLGLTPFFKAPYMRTKDSPFAYSDIPQLRRPHYPDLPALKEAMRDCPNPRNVFTMLIDGSVVACCHDYSKATNFGNIFEQDVMEIWNSPAFSAFRRNVRNGDTPAFCLDYCMSYLLDPSAASADRKRGAVVAPPLVPQARPARVLEKRVNLCSGSRPLGGYINVDLLPGADVRLDLEQELLPFENDSIDVLVCMSAINYFSRDRALEIVRDVHRVLKPGGVARFGTQDLKLLAEKYLDRDEGFYFERLSDGRDRFPGKTFADKLNEFFYGFRAGDKHCRYVYDFESLGEVFHEAGFSLVERMPYQQSRLPDVTAIDNRPEQMFFLEAVKTSEVVVDLEPLATSALPPGQTSRMSESLAGLHKSLRRAVVASGSARASHRSVGPTAARSRAAPAQTASLRDQALALWRRGEAQTAWQWLCRAFEAAPGDRALLETLEQVLRRQERWADLTKLYESYLAANPGDTEAQAARRVLPPVPPTLATQNQRAAAQRADLARLPIGTNTPRSDRAHLDAAIAWLLTAQKANSGGGVSAMRYLAAERWDVDYPETTGYIIPTLLAYARLSGRDEIREAAIRMGDWEVAIQSPEGGVGEPLGVFGQRPRVFNTGQVILGWVALYRETGREDYLTAARRAANWILANLESDGRWVANTYCGPRAYKSRVSWALLELQAVTGESRYGEAARRSLAWILSQSLDTGWFRNNSLSEPERPWTHLVGYVLVGLLEARRLDADGAGGEKTLHLLHTAARGLMAHYQLSKDAAGDRFATLAGTFDSGWQSRDDWSCVTGTAQIEFFLRRLSAYIDDSRLVESADALLLDLKRIQLIDGIHDPCVLGGLPGSVPLDGPYCGWAIPNWGVKFFADSLLQRLLPPDQRDCLG